MSRTGELHFPAYFSSHRIIKFVVFRRARQYVTSRRNVIREQSNAMLEKYRVTVRESTSKFFWLLRYTHVADEPPVIVYHRSSFYWLWNYLAPVLHSRLRAHKSGTGKTARGYTSKKKKKFPCTHISHIESLDFFFSTEMYLKELYYIFIAIVRVTSPE